LKDAVAELVMEMGRLLTEMGNFVTAAERLKTEVERAVMQDVLGAGGAVGLGEKLREREEKALIKEKGREEEVVSDDEDED
ncbi:MAG: hypothetical protein Q9184_006569, partial [Pyrenodesmia sp. 2 TL-2023]